MSDDSQRTMNEPAPAAPPQSIQISPDASAIGPALEWLEACTEAAGLPMRAMFALNLGLDETLANIIMHGFKADTAHTRDVSTGAPAIRIECTDGDDFFELRIADNGVAFDPTARQPGALAESLEEATLGGHGLRLMRHFLHDLQYQRRDGWNELRMQVRRDEPESSGPPED